MGTGQRRVLSGVECWSSDEAVPPRDPRRDHPSHHDKRTLTFQKPALRKHLSVLFFCFFLPSAVAQPEKRNIGRRGKHTWPSCAISGTHRQTPKSVSRPRSRGSRHTVREGVTCGRQGIIDGGAAGQRSNSSQKRADLPMTVCLIYVGLSSPKVEPTVPHGTKQRLCKWGVATYGKMSSAYEDFDALLDNGPHRVQFYRL